jgi:zinc protease
VITREDKHWSYGAQSVFFPAKGQQPFVALAPVQTDKTRESLAEMNKEFHDFAAARPVTTQELQAAVEDRTLSLSGSRESLRSTASTVEQIVEFGYSDDYFDTYAAKVKSLKIADIQDAARTVIHPDNLIWIVVGDRAKIEAGIRALNLGDLHVIDADGNPRDYPNAIRREASIFMYITAPAAHKAEVTRKGVFQPPRLTSTGSI